MRRLWALVVLLAAPLPAVEPPRLIVESTERASAATARIERMDRSRLRTAMEYTGLGDPGVPIRVLVTDESTVLARGVPPHIAGFAIPEQGIVVVFPARTTSYPDNGLEELLHHEIAHILIDRAVGGAPVPRWLHEGLATTIGTAWSPEDRARVAFEVMVGGESSLAALDRAFAGTPAEARRAYALSGAFVRDTVQRHGAVSVARLFARLRERRSLETAFYMATGERLDVAERRFWKRQTLWHRWIPFITSSLALWIAITILALHAIRWRRRRNAAIRAMWEEGEIEEDEPVN